MATLEILNPVAEAVVRTERLAPRPESLNGKRVGLYWNIKAGGDHALDRVEKLLSERYEGVSFVRLIGSVGVAMRHLTQEDAEEMAPLCDVVVGTTGDCGSCTSWLIHDMVQMERLGVASVSYVSETFVKDARHSAATFGMANLPIAVPPLPFTNQSPDSIGDMVAGTIDEVLNALTLTPGVPTDFDMSEIVTFPEKELSFEGEDLLDAADNMNKEFISYGWSDGLVLRPPRPKDVEEMMRLYKGEAEELVAVLEPGFGQATIEKIAINAVMAGAAPEHMPVIVAAIKTLAEPQMYLRTKAMSTGPAAPLLLVNGPVTQELGINSGICALGPGSTSYANTAIGRTVRLCMMNVGHTYPGISDLDTIGTPAKYSMCLAEGEQDNPWSPYHVEKGFQPSDSTVTVQFVYGVCDMFDFQSFAPEPLVEVFATALTNAALADAGMWMLGRRADPRHGTEEKEHTTVILAPEHAEIFAHAGWTKADIKQAFWEKARLPFDLVTKNKEPKAILRSHPELGWLFASPETLVPVVEDPDCYDLVVAGGAAGRSTVMWGMGGPMTTKIETRT